MLLNNMEYDSNFPSLPKTQNNPVFSFSQPNFRSKSSIRNPDSLSQSHRMRPGPSSLNLNNKKRKASSPLSQTPPSSPMFPFRFGPSSPLPPNPSKPDLPNLKINENKLTESLSNYFISMLGKINSLDDIKRVDSHLVRKDIELVVKDNLHNS